MSGGLPPGLVWVEAARLDDLVPGVGREFARSGRVYALFLVGDRVVALDGLCPHQKARLAGAQVDADRDIITCPRRGCLRWRFDLRSGASADGMAVRCPVHPVAIDGDRVLVALPG